MRAQKDICELGLEGAGKGGIDLEKLDDVFFYYSADFTFPMCFGNWGQSVWIVGIAFGKVQSSPSLVSPLDFLQCRVTLSRLPLCWLVEGLIR